MVQNNSDEFPTNPQVSGILLDFHLTPHLVKLLLELSTNMLLGSKLLLAFLERNSQTRKIFFSLWRRKKRYIAEYSLNKKPMVLILGGNLEICALVRSNLCYFISLRPLIRSRAVTHRFFAMRHRIIKLIS